MTPLLGTLIGVGGLDEATQVWLLQTVQDTNRGMAVLRVEMAGVIGLLSSILVLQVFILFWLKKKFREAGELFMAAKVAHMAAAVEKDITQGEVRKVGRHVDVVVARATEMKAQVEQMTATATSMKETVAASHHPTIPVPVVVVPLPHHWKPGDPERRMTDSELGKLPIPTLPPETTPQTK